MNYVIQIPDRCHERAVGGHLLCRFCHSEVVDAMVRESIDILLAFPITEPLVGDNVVADSAVLSEPQRPVSGWLSRVWASTMLCGLGLGPDLMTIHYDSTLSIYIYFLSINYMIYLMIKSDVST